MQNNRLLSICLALLTGSQLGLLACSAPESKNMSPENLIDTTWQLVALGGQTPDPRITTTLTFSAERIAGNGGCNRYTSRYQITAERIEIAPVGGTKKACERVVMDHERTYFSALETAERIAQPDAATLLIYSAGQTEPLRFRPAP